jgi:hypothetical protein
MMERKRSGEEEGEYIRHEKANEWMETCVGGVNWRKEDWKKKD